MIQPFRDDSRSHGPPFECDITTSFGHNIIQIYIPMSYSSCIEKKNHDSPIFGDFLIYIPIFPDIDIPRMGIYSHIDPLLRDGQTPRFRPWSPSPKNRSPLPSRCPCCHGDAASPRQWEPHKFFRRPWKSDP